MKSSGPDNPVIIELIFGVGFTIIGVLFLLRRKKVVEALIISSKVFWEKMGLGFLQNDKIAFIITNFMIPVIGLVFSIVGFLLTCNAVYRIVIILKGLFIK